MAEKTVAIKLKIVQPTDTKKSLDALTQVSTKWEKTFGKDGTKQVKAVTDSVGRLTKAWHELGGAIKTAREHFKSGFEQGSASLRGLQNFTRGIEGATRKVFNLKNALAGTVVGGAAIYGIHKLFDEGAQQIRTKRRLRREFGDEAQDFLDLGNRVGFRSGIQGDEAAKALIPLGEQLQAIQKGSRFRGQKKALTEDQAEALRFKNLAFGADLFQRIQTLVPDVESDELGRVLGDALSGPEGIRTLVSTLHLSKRSKALSQANEKGEAFKALSPEERKRFGITAKGQYLEQGDLVNLLLQRSGITDAAAEDARKDFGFQVRSITSQLTDTLGDIGEGALDSLTDKLGKGATAAERLQGYLSSKEGQQAVDGIKNAVVGVVEGVVSIGKELPKIGSWLSEHKRLLELLAGAYIAAKAAPGLSALGGGISALGGTGTGALARGARGLGGALGKVVPVAGAAFAGYEFGSYLDEKFGLSDKIAGTTGKRDEAAEQRNAAAIAAKGAGRAALIRSLESAGISRGLAIRYADHPEEAGNSPVIQQLLKSGGGDLNVTTNLVVDGQTLAKIVSKHQVRDIQNRTANGAAPVSRQ